jgi:flavin reductase (DIM6/NTAB) family NADH-FMN oxidoreductase RutF
MELPMTIAPSRASQQQQDVQQAADATVVKKALRKLAGGVCVIGVGKGEDRSGATVTSATGLSMDPPTMIVSINRSSSSWPLIQRYRHFSVNILADEHQHIADRFAGVGGVKGADRYHGAHWTTLVSGAPVLSTALAAVDCEVEEIIERHSHAIIIGRAVAVLVGEGSSLVYHDGGYVRLGG